MRDFRSLADTIAHDIRSGTLKSGDRLPPQREFAYDRGIAVSTAARVYAELVRRGLVTGEVGRGTYVLSPLSRPAPALAEPGTAPVDLELNFPILPEQGARLAAGLARVMRPSALTGAMRHSTARGTAEARQIAARGLARGTWTPDPSCVLFTGNGRQAVAAAMTALALPGERIGVEAMTYPVVKSIAARLGIALVPLALDGEGVRPDAIAQAHREQAIKGLYLQPTLHNPLGLTMGAKRRKDVADAAAQTGLTIIEDTVYSFLADDTPLVARAPDHVILVDSLSKRVAPGTTLGFVVPPAALVDRLVAAIRSGAWVAPGFPLAVGLQWMTDGAVSEIAMAKRKDAATRQELARKALAGLGLKSDPKAYHLWLELPEPWRADTFCTAAARLGIAVTPASAFTVHQGHAPNAVRIALASPPLEGLRAALDTLARLARTGDDHVAE